ncbi:protein abnormal spindle [Aricia agestis]|uniref:protein abnormal spindle n=1 Tax=Aricia agestis TaxID=91739 RepID=UPI001C201C66|nr:protein abnormal spindle [Aricia agestis]
MYFEIENTPEHLKRARKKEVVQNASPKEECPRLILAPFSRPPQVVFDNVLIGTSCQRELEIYNPTKQTQQITLGKSLPPGLVIDLLGEWLVVEPETCYCLTMIWTPNQPTALRETLRFTNENRGRYDVIIVLKAVLNVKRKNGQPKLKVSPGKIKKKSSKKSPVAIIRKKSEIIYNTTKLKTVNVVQTKQYEVFKSSNKENLSMQYDQFMNSNRRHCPFDSPSSADLNFNTSEVFSNRHLYKNNENLYDTYDKSYSTTQTENNRNNGMESRNVLKPSNKQTTDPMDIFDNLSFTPLKTLQSKNEKLEKGPKIVLSMNSDSEFDDSLDIKGRNKENETHSIICITSTQNPQTWLSVNNCDKLVDNQYAETPVLQNKKIPNTSSPKELNSPNFSINTDFSRISELSFLPQRFSTERKMFPKINNETHDFIDDVKLNTDTFTKDSPYTPLDQYRNQLPEQKQPLLSRDNSKMCRQALFKENMQQMHQRENARQHLQVPENSVWSNDFRAVSSPPRSVTPPLQSIPEESTQYPDTYNFDKSDKQTTFTINRTFDKPLDQINTSIANRQSTWSKKSKRVETNLWKVPAPVTKKDKPRNSIKSRDSMHEKGNRTFDKSKIVQNTSFNQYGSVYAQSFTVDPFLSSTYFYDEEAVEKFETEFKRWLNYILTPPADLDSNVEYKFDVGKAWIENRNKEIPLAPTKEQVCSAYHNSYRLESLRRSARNLLLSPDVSQVFLKLNAQIEKKLIAIRNDRNLHLDIGLQKVIMEILLSYNPLWLRIGLEAIYGIVLPLKSNSDIEGLTVFIIQRMFKNPHLKNKHSKSSAPNMLLPAYMEAIKKFTLKKFFMLVFFLDQAKQKKLISHDPCLFCRNAICKESREIIIRFTRELIAGIGDITKHLRPLGYVVSHKQSYLDEYKFAVHNLAVDIRDGVRLTKVMEIILMKHSLMNQLRTPAISRLQKIHNVHVALNALKESNFTIVGDITSTDIADGHREKTLSLLWQIIHVFRAPLFEKAANVIQTWWRKKFEVIMEKRREEERILAQRNAAAALIQDWWRRIQYNKMVEHKMAQITTATVIIQKYCRMWLCRNKLRLAKLSVWKICDWYKRVKMIREAKATLCMLKQQREQLRQKSAVVLQSYVRRWLCVKQYKQIVRKVILIQSVVRCFLMRRQYLHAQKSIVFVQKMYKNKLLMRKEMKQFSEVRKRVIIIQSFVRMVLQRRSYLRLKEAVKTVDEIYKAKLEMRIQRNRYVNLRLSVIKIQSIFRGRRDRRKYLKQRDLIISVQRKVRANQCMKRDRENFLRLKNATIVLQKRIKSYLLKKSLRSEYILKRQSAIKIQSYFRAYLLGKMQKNYYVQLKKSTKVIQDRYRSIIAMRRDRQTFMKLKSSVIVVQRRYRAQLLMRDNKARYEQLKKSCILIQNKYRALVAVRIELERYQMLKTACIMIQRRYRANVLAIQQRQIYLRQKDAAIKIQTWLRSVKKGKEVKQDFVQKKQACITIQTYYRAFIIGKQQRQEYIRIRTATICIQKYYRSYILTKTIRQEFIRLKSSTVTIQRFYRSFVEMKQQKENYSKTRNAIITIQNYFRCYLETKKLRYEYVKLKAAAVCIQRRYRSLCLMRNERATYLKLKQSAISVQRRYRAMLAMRKDRKLYLERKSAAIIIQNKFRAWCTMKRRRTEYLTTLRACITIQARYRAYWIGMIQRNEYLKVRQAIVTVQQRYRAKLAMRKARNSYVTLRKNVVTFQERFRANKLMRTCRFEYVQKLIACVTIQRRYRAYRIGKQQRDNYELMRKSAVLIQRRYREYREYIMVHSNYLQLRNAVITVQRRLRTNNEARKCRSEFLNIRNKVIFIQSYFRMFFLRKQFVRIRDAATEIQVFYRNAKLAKQERERYISTRHAIIKLQAHVRCFIQRKRYLRIRSTVLAIQALYRLKKHRDRLKKRQIEAAICIQKNIRCYLQQSWYKNYRARVIFIQKLWRSKLHTRYVRCDFLQKKTLVTKLQAAIRGYLVRRKVTLKKEELIRIKEEKRQNWAATKIQALFRGHKVRATDDRRAKDLRRRWREGALRSTQESLKDRNEEAMDVLRNMSDIETVIRAFRSLELLTEVFPMMYNSNASSIVRRVYIYMSLANRSISSIEMLKSAASILVNLARYRITGPKIYDRERIEPVLKFMWRFSNSEVELFRILATYLWLFTKYHAIKKDLAEFLRLPENHKMLVTIKGNVLRMKRMASKHRNRISCTPQHPKTVSHTMNMSLRDSISVSSNHGIRNITLPTLEPDYGIVRADKPRYFEDAEEAILCLFHAYEL